MKQARLSAKKSIVSKSKNSAFGGQISAKPWVAKGNRSRLMIKKGRKEPGKDKKTEEIPELHSNHEDLVFPTLFTDKMMNGQIRNT